MKTLPDLTGYVNASGKPVIADPNSPSFKAAAKVSRGGPVAFHRGFSVEGHPPGLLAEAQRLADEETARWDSLTAQEQAQRIKEGQRAPKPWDLTAFLQRTKKKKVRARPFEVPDAADVCAQIARREGWEYVEVVEVKREAPPMQQGYL